MIDLEQFRKNAESHGMCSEYYGIWDECHSNRQIADMALGVKALDFLFDGISKGWGASPEYIAIRFKSFINGRYVSKQKGYTSKMYCMYSGEVEADTTILSFINSTIDLLVPKNAICEVYCVGKCKISVTCFGEAKFICYGNPEDVVIDGDVERVERINKKEKDSNG